MRLFITMMQYGSLCLMALYNHRQFHPPSQDKSSSSGNVLTNPMHQLEMSMKGAKCLKCQKTKYIAKNCTEFELKFP